MATKFKDLLVQEVRLREDYERKIAHQMQEAAKTQAALEAQLRQAEAIKEEALRNVAAENIAAV